MAAGAIDADHEPARVLTNPAIQQMTQKRAELQSQYEQDLQRRKPEHPAVQQEAAAIRELDRQIATLAGSVRDSIRNQYLTAQKQESELAGAVGHLKGSTLAEQQLGIRYNILKREVTTNRELYNGLLQRYKEVSAEAGSHVEQYFDRGSCGSAAFPDLSEATHQPVPGHSHRLGRGYDRGRRS